jgi:N-acetyl-anhydromuramyl-L-alanine amidase AmpD
MNGTGDYDYVDNSGSIDSRNIGDGRPSPIGALLHTTSGYSSLDWLLSGSARVGTPASADYLIDRNGTQHRLCPDGYYPYHAGKSALTYANRLYQGDEVSALLIGIELECADKQNCTFPQLDSLSSLIVRLSSQYGWRWPYVIFGHYEVALPVGRRSDPLGFDWGSFMGRLYVRSRAAGIGGLG